MDLLKLWECKKENKRICNMLQDMACAGELRDLPKRSRLGKHFSQIRFQPDENGVVLHQPQPWSFEDMQPIWNIRQCGSEVTGLYHKETGAFHPTGFITCNSPLCAICATKRAYTVRSQIAWILNERIRKEDYKFFFATLTLPNEFGGFADTYLKLRKVAKDTFEYLGMSKSGRDDLYCKGLFGSYEITHNTKTGWHPHLHILLAYGADDVKRYEKTRKTGKHPYGQIKSLVLKADGHRQRDLSLYGFKEYFYNALVKRYPDYVREYDQRVGRAGALAEYLQIDFCPVEDVDSAVLELTKYLIKLTDLKTPEELKVYLRDSFGLAKYHKLGFFGWKNGMEEEWRESLRAKETVQIENDYFVYFGDDFIEDNKSPLPGYYPASAVQTVTLSYRKDGFGDFAYYFIRADGSVADGEYDKRYDRATLERLALYKEKRRKEAS